MFDKLKSRIVVLLETLLVWYASTDPEGSPTKKRAHDIIGWAVETGIGVVIFSVIYGSVAVPYWMTVSTSGWPSYTALIWPLVPFVALAAFLYRCYNFAKMSYTPPITGGVYY